MKFILFSEVPEGRFFLYRNLLFRKDGHCGIQYDLRMPTPKTPSVSLLHCGTVTKINLKLDMKSGDLIPNDPQVILIEDHPDN